MDAEKVVVGCEPTGHYWFNFARYVKQSGMTLVLVNPYHVKQTKELDDNSPTKNDRKAPKTIAKLVSEGRDTFPCAGRYLRGIAAGGLKPGPVR